MLKKLQIEQYIKELRDFNIGDKKQKNLTNSKRVNPILQKFKALRFIILSFFDFVVLKLILSFAKYRNKKIVYTTARFTTVAEGTREDRILKPLFTDNILFINHSLQDRISRINNQKTYNIGGVVKVLSFFQRQSSLTMRNFYAYQKVNQWILKKLAGKEIYLLLYYDLNSLSIILSPYRNTLKLIEVQHGSMINYFPYIKRAPLKVIDVFYVKNQPTIDFLKNHLCKDYDCEYRLLPYPNTQKNVYPGKYILYASTVELNGIHPVFLDYLNQNGQEDLTVYIRLHPREKNKKAYFKEQLQQTKATIIFDESKNWLESNTIKNIVVVSAWSSMIEDAADNGYKTIILEEFGKKRFGYLIDNKNVIFAPDVELLKNVLN